MSSGRWFRRWVEAAGGLLYPPHCAVCTRPTGAREGGLCRPCRRARPRLLDPRCAVCSQPYSGVVPGHFRCMNCGDLELAFAFATAAYRSRGPVRELIHNFKYRGHQHVRHLLARMLREGFRDPRVAAHPPEVLVPVPLHPTRQREREFNQAEVLARLAGARLGLPVIPALRRTRYTLTQTNFHRDERFANLEGAFVTRPGVIPEGATVALIDDVLTTGSTADACARALLDGGAAAVVVITVARG